MQLLFFFTLFLLYTLAENADFAGGTTKNTVTVNTDVTSVEVPLPLNDDTVGETDESFLCFVSTNRFASVTNGRISLTIQDDDSLSEWAIPKREDVDGYVIILQ